MVQTQHQYNKKSKEKSISHFLRRLKEGSFRNKYITALVCYIETPSKEVNSHKSLPSGQPYYPRKHALKTCASIIQHLGIEMINDTPPFCELSCYRFGRS